MNEKRTYANTYIDSQNIGERYRGLHSTNYEKLPDLLKGDDGKELTTNQHANADDQLIKPDLTPPQNK